MSLETDDGGWLCTNGTTERGRKNLGFRLMLLNLYWEAGCTSSILMISSKGMTILLMN